MDSGLVRLPATEEFGQRVAELCRIWSDEDGIMERLREKSARIQAARANERRRQLRRKRERIARWRAGDPAVTWLELPQGWITTPFCASGRGGRRETSLDIRVEAQEALRLWRLVERVHADPSLFRHETVHDCFGNRWSVPHGRTVSSPQVATGYATTRWRGRQES
ncbi:hypothetical protein FACS1894159_07690 [Bacteroidia bacterium]|nr:hypothetical protein FACS1894159_07690 [Bacteroidia bacterium]